jgi:hypothetical protein
MSVYPGRYTAQIDAPFVVLLVGMRDNRFWQFRKCVPVFRSMNQMLRTLCTNPGAGFLGARVGFMGTGPVLVQVGASGLVLSVWRIVLGRGGDSGGGTGG